MKNRFEDGLIIFDLDGTLIDSSEDIAWSANRTLEWMGYGSRAMREIKDSIGWGVKPLLEKLMPLESPERIELARKRFLEFYGGHLVEGTRLYPGVRDTLEMFRSSKMKMAVVTNKPEGLACAILDALEMTGFFACVIGGDTLANKKPHPEPLEKAVSGARADASRSVMIGDSPIDCEAGKAAGLFTIGVSYGFRDRKELENAGFDVIVDRFADLKDIII